MRCWSHTSTSSSHRKPRMSGATSQETGKEGDFLRALRGSVAGPHPQFQASGPRNCKRTHLCCFKSSGDQYLVTAAPETNIAIAIAKSLQSCPTLCDPIDGSPPGSPLSGILQARTLDWVAISFSNA